MKINAWFIVAVTLLLPEPAYSQRLLFGVKVRGQITTTFPYLAPPVIHEDRVVFGPTIEMAMKHGLSLELDALYKPRVGWPFGPLPLQVAADIGSSSMSGDVSAHSWQFPLLLKWKVSPLPLYVGAGFSVLNIGVTEHNTGFVSAGPGLPTSTFDYQISQTELTYGPVVAAGADILVGSFHIQRNCDTSGGKIRRRLTGSRQNRTTFKPSSALRLERDHESDAVPNFFPSELFIKREVRMCVTVVIPSFIQPRFRKVFRSSRSSNFLNHRNPFVEWLKSRNGPPIVVRSGGGRDEINFPGISAM